MATKKPTRRRRKKKLLVVRHELAFGFPLAHPQCPECGRCRVNTSRDWSVCPNGHGRLWPPVVEADNWPGTEPKRVSARRIFAAEREGRLEFAIQAGASKAL